MNERRIRAEMLAVMSNCSISTIYNVLAGKKFTETTRRAIEIALEVKLQPRKLQTRRKAA